MNERQGGTPLCSSVGFAAALRCNAMAMMVGDELKALLDAVAKLQPVLTDPSHFSDLTLVRTHSQSQSSSHHKHAHSYLPLLSSGLSPC